jgi:hypothetical protein
MEIKHDPVNKPSHYTDGKIKVIDFIEDKKLGYHLGNCIKYIARAGKKDPSKKCEDLQKARWYLDREISNSLQTVSGSLPSSVKNLDDDLYKDFIKSGKLKKQLKGKNR